MVSLREVLLHLGFFEDWSVVLTDELPGYVFDFENVRLEAKELHNLRLQPVFSFYGFFQNARSIGSVEFEVPIQVESLEQGTAWIVDALCRHRNFKPAFTPSWMAEGRSLSSHLPWVRKQLAFASRPRFSTDRSWIVAVRMQLRRLPALDGQAKLNFDGEIARLLAPGASMAFAAEGFAWPNSVSFALSDFNTAIKRLAGPTIECSVWEGYLAIGRVRFNAEVL